MFLVAEPNFLAGKGDRPGIAYLLSREVDFDVILSTACERLARARP
jgi:hypothetical protein